MDVQGQFHRWLFRGDFKEKSGVRGGCGPWGSQLSSRIPCLVIQRLLVLGHVGGNFGEAVPTPGQCVHATSRQRAQASRPQSHKPADVWPSTEVKMERPKGSPTNSESQAPLISCHPAVAPLWPLPPTL